MSTVHQNTVLDLQNEMNDDFRHVKSLLFLLASVNQETVPVNTIQEVSHFLAYQVEALETKFNTLCGKMKCRTDIRVEKTSLSVETWEIVKNKEK